MILTNSMSEMSYEELLYIEGGKDNIVFWGGVAMAAICVVAVAASTVAGAVIGGPVGAGAAFTASSKAVAVPLVSSVGAIALSLRY